MGIKGFLIISKLSISFCGIALHHEWENDTVRNPPAEIILRNFLLDLYAVLIFNNKSVLRMHLYMQ